MLGFGDTGLIRDGLCSGNSLLHGGRQKGKQTIQTCDKDTDQVRWEVGEAEEEPGVEKGTPQFKGTEV